jgi:hypothetical protein
MKGEAYPAARSISPSLHAYFACHRDAALRAGEMELAPLPSAETIEAIIDAAFWASLRREEGYIPRISLAYLAPEDTHVSLRLERPLLLTPTALTRVAPAVEQPGIHLGVSGHTPELCVWGATNAIPRLCFVLEVAAPGLLVIKHHNGEESRKFTNVAVLEGDQIKLVEDPSPHLPHPSPLLESLLQSAPVRPGEPRSGALIQLAVAMRAHGRGGSLLIVPADCAAWRESIIQPIPYALDPPFRELSGPRPASPTAIAAIGGLTAVDGALVMNNRYEVLGFGAKIAGRPGYPRVEEVLWSEPIRGAAPTLVHPDQLGGTRHLSAAQFVHDQRDAIALVASQDGRFTVFQWSGADSKVEAHRLESLLL